VSKSDIAINFDGLWEIVARQYALGGGSVHGPMHWRAVEKTGLVIAAQCGADDVIVKLFAIFHDSKR
jgi:uncharacterized protein